MTGTVFLTERQIAGSWIAGATVTGSLLTGLCIRAWVRGKNRAIARLPEEGELQFRAAFEQAGVGMAHVSPAGRLIRVNRKFRDITGYSQSELVGKTSSDLTHPGDLERDREQLKALVRGDIATYSVEKRYFGRSARLIFMSLTVSLVRRANGEADYFILVAEDITQRKAEEERWRVMEPSPEGIAYVERQAIVKLANPSFYRIIGWTPEQFAAEQMDLRRLTPAEWRERTDECVQTCVETGRPVVFEKEFFRRDGSRVPVRIGLSFQEGYPEDGVVFVQDLSELRQTEQLLRASEERFRRVVEAGPSAKIMTTGDGLIRLVNAQAEKLFGYERSEMTGKPVEMLIPQAFREGHRIQRAGFAEAPEVRAMRAGRDLFGLRKDGREVPIEIRLNPLSTAEGDFVLATIVDITERKVAEDALRESARQLVQLADAMPQMVWTCAPDGSVEYRNLRLRDYTGLPVRGSEESMGRVIHADDAGPMQERWTASLTSGQPYEFQARLWDLQSARWRWHLNRALPIRDAEGKLTRWVGTSTDIQDHKKLSEELESRVEQRTADLRNSLREKEVLLQEVHHRVKNNLTVISSLLYLQSTYTENEETVRILRESQDRVRSMALVHETLYRSDNFASVNFAEYAGDLARQLLQTYRVQAADVRLVCDLQPVQLTIDRAIPCGLILNELVTNALRHAFPPGAGAGRAREIRLDLEQRGETVRLEVSDTGAGLPADFDIGSAQYAAKSLGMRLVHSLASQLDGSIGIVSGIAGTRIRLTLDRTFAERRA